MLNKKITDLVEVSELNDTDKFLVETERGTRSVPFNVISDSCKGAMSAAAHNGIYRGDNLLDKYTIEQLHTMVSAGDFSDIYIGDYIDVKISTSYKSDETVRLLVAHLDYFLGNGETECTDHHILFVPEDCFATKDYIQHYGTSAGYSKTNMHTTVLPNYYTALNGADALNGHILTHSRYLASDEDSTVSYQCTWTDTNLCLMNEVMVYGTIALSSSGWDVGDAQIQLALFRLAPHKKIAHLGHGSTSRSSYWLCSKYQSALICNVYYNGTVYRHSTEDKDGIRPYLLFS